MDSTDPMDPMESMDSMESSVPAMLNFLRWGWPGAACMRCLAILELVWSALGKNAEIVVRIWILTRPTFDKKNDTEGIRTPAGRAQWITSPSH